MACANDVADLFLSWANRDGDLLSNLKLQKLIYYAQAWYLANHKKPLFADEIEAWELGPVIPELYRRFKKFKNNPIRYVETGLEESKFTKKELKYLQDFYLDFIDYSAHTLVSATHNEPPWKETPLNGVISTRSMQQYYSSLITK